MNYERTMTIKTMHGVRTVYQLETGRFVCADYSHMVVGELPIDETMLFDCREDGFIEEWSELWVTPGNTASNDECIEEWLNN